jgi:hypothetical protein
MVIMDVSAFAEQHRLRAKKDDCSNLVILGKQFAAAQSHIFDGFLDGLGVCLMFETSRQWNSARRKLEKAGFVTRQDGDTEGVLTFDPTDSKQSRLALKVVGTRKPRTLSPEQRQRLCDQLERVRKLEAVLA